MGMTAKRAARALCTCITTAGISASVIVATDISAAATETIQCRSSATLFGTTQDGSLKLYKHTEPETGVESWETNTGQFVGSGWTGARIVGGPDGRLYGTDAGGALNRFRWNGTAWEKAPDGKDYTTIDHGWDRYQTAEYRNRITADEGGYIYTVEPDGNLHQRRYDEQAKTWEHHVLDGDWKQYDLIVAGGSGVLYARTPNGDFFRFRYHTESQRWTQYRKQVGSGWNIYSAIMSPGGDVLYGTNTGNGDLFWHRYLQEGDSYVAGAGKRVGKAWNLTPSATAVSDSCKLLSFPTPARATTPLDVNAPSAVTEDKEGKAQYFYVNNFGSLVHGRQRSDDLTLVDFSAIPGNQQFAGDPAAIRTSDNVRVVGLGQDGESRTATQAAGATAWSPLDSFGGWTPGPVILTSDTGVYTGFVVDAAGGLWYRVQDPASKMFFGWRNLGTTNLTRDITATPTTGGVALIVRTTDGHYVRAQFHNGTLGAWTPVGGTEWKYRAAATAIPNDRVQVFATRTDGTVTVQTETAAGFDGQVQALPGVTAIGAPAAITASSGITQIAVHGNDGYIYITESTAPGSSAYRPWVRLADSRTGASYPASTDPTVMVRANGATLYTFRDRDGVTYTYTSTTPATGFQRRAVEEPPRTAYTGGRTHGEMSPSN